MMNDHTSATDPLLKEIFSEELMPLSSEGTGSSHINKHWLWDYLWLWGPNLTIFLISVSFLCVAYSTRYPKTPRCVDKLSMYSPALEVVSDEYEIVRFNATFRKPSIYKGNPNPELDEAWDKLIHVGAFRISQDELQKIGAPKNSCKFRPEDGGGYMAQLEVHHQIHCVNLLWQMTNPEYYAEKRLSYGDSPATFRLHLDHCADILRQKLMCNADVGVLTYNWVRGLSHPTPNFNSLHKCRRFNDIYAWELRNQVHVHSEISEIPLDAEILDELP